MDVLRRPDVSHKEFTGILRQLYQTPKMPYVIGIFATTDELVAVERLCKRGQLPCQAFTSVYGYDLYVARRGEERCLPTGKGWSETRV